MSQPGIIEQTQIDCVTKRRGESDALVRSALEMRSVPRPIVPASLHPSPLPKGPTSGIRSSALEAVDLGRAEWMQVESGTQSVTDSQELWSEQR